MAPNGCYERVRNFQAHLLIIWTVAFYIIENFQEELSETSFTQTCVQGAVSAAGAGEDVTPLGVYLQIVRGLERLLLAGVLNKMQVRAMAYLN